MKIFFLFVIGTCVLPGCHPCGCAPTPQALYLGRHLTEVTYEIVISLVPPASDNSEQTMIRASVNKLMKYINREGKDSVTTKTPVMAGEEIKFSCSDRNLGRFDPIYAYTNKQGIAETKFHLNKKMVRNSQKIKIQGTYKGRYKGYFLIL